MPQAKKKAVKKTVKKKANRKVAVKRTIKPIKANCEPLAAFLLLDRSASMSAIWDKAIGAINSYVTELAAQSPDAEVTLAVFDSMAGLKFDILRKTVKAKNWKAVNTEEAHPRGNTPLFDAIGQFVGLALKSNRERTVLVIETDGYENASTAVNRDAATALLDTCRAKGWQTIFLGANFDAMPQAQSLNNNFGATISILPQNLAVSMSALAGHTHSYATRGEAVNFTQADRTRAMSSSTTS